MYAIVAYGGRQYQVEPGQVVVVELTEELKSLEVGSQLSLKNVLFINNEGSVKVGRPAVSGAEVKVKVAGQGKGKKIRVETYKKRKNFKRTYGHRQPFVRLAVEEIIAG